MGKKQGNVPRKILLAILLGLASFFLDAAVIDAFHLFRTPVLDAVFGFFTDILVIAVAMLILPAVALLLRKDVQKAVLLCLAFLFAFLIGVSTKLAVHRLRPPLSPASISACITSATWLGEPSSAMLSDGISRTTISRSREQCAASLRPTALNSGGRWPTSYSDWPSFSASRQESSPPSAWGFSPSSDSSYPSSSAGRGSPSSPQCSTPLNARIRADPSPEKACCSSCWEAFSACSSSRRTSRSRPSWC